MKFPALIFLMETASTYNTWADGPTFDIGYDATKSMLKLTATVPQDNYLAIGFGEGMTNVDMVHFKATGAGEVVDLWSTGVVAPTTDTTNDYTDTVIDTTTDPTKYSFTTYRPLDTGDTTQDSVITCDKKVEYYWAGSTTTASMVKHNKLGEFYVNYDASCNPTIEAGDDSDSDDEDGAVFIKGAAALGAAAAAFMVL